jgi:hypothetical protein
MRRARLKPQELGRWGRPTKIRLDPAFEALLPPLAPQEQKRLEEALHVEGCREPLVVWPFPKQQVLIVGYPQFRLLKLHRIPFRVIERRFESRDEARMFIIRDQLARRHLSPLAVSYLRGLRYAGEKHPHGGDYRSAEVRGQFNGLKTAEALAAEFGVSAATIRRDGAVAEAVNVIAAGCGADARAQLLSPGARLKRGALLDLAAQDLGRQRAVLEALKRRRSVPRTGRPAGQPQTITLPRAPALLVPTLLERLSHEEVIRIRDELNLAVSDGRAEE